MIDVAKNSQKILEEVLKRYGRFRDYHHDVYNIGGSVWAALYYIANAVATSLNATLISEGHPQYQSLRTSMANSSFPRTVPGVRLLERQRLNVDRVWKQFYPRNVKKEMPHFIKKEDALFNFAVCGELKRKGNSSWDFTIFTDSLDVWTYSRCTACEYHLNQIETRARFYTRINLHSKRPPCTNGRGENQRSKLFVLWTLICIVLLTFYTGEMTSFVIKPPPEEVMKKIWELEKIILLWFLVSSFFKGN